MDKWEYLLVNNGYGVSIRPSSKATLDWLLEIHPKIKIVKSQEVANRGHLVYYLSYRRDEDLVEESAIFMEVLDYLGNQGWEAYAHDGCRHYFKRKL